MLDFRGAQIGEALGSVAVLEQLESLGSGPP